MICHSVLNLWIGRKSFPRCIFMSVLWNGSVVPCYQKGILWKYFCMQTLGFWMCEGNPPWSITVMEITEKPCVFWSDGSLLYTSLKPLMKWTLMLSFCCWKAGFNSKIETSLTCPIEASRNPIRITLKCPLPRPAVVFGSYGQGSRILCGIWRINSSQSHLCAFISFIYCLYQNLVLSEFPSFLSVTRQTPHLWSIGRMWSHGFWLFSK